MKYRSSLSFSILVEVKMNCTRCALLLLSLSCTVSISHAQQLIPHRKPPQQPAPVPKPQPVPTRSDVTIPAGVPLHIQVTRTAHLHIGTPVFGTLTESIYVGDRLVLPAGSPVHGTVTAYVPIAHIEREQALLNGDVTPLHAPVVDFTSVHLIDRNMDVPLDTTALMRATALVRFVKTKKKSRFRKLMDDAKTTIHNGYEGIIGLRKKDNAIRFVYNQLPYHPQRIWAGTQFVADLDAPSTVQLPFEPAVPQSDATTLNGITVDARLINSINSKTSKKGDAVTALVTEPVFDKNHKLILPEGTELDGLVSASKPARKLGHNGQLRFAIRGVKEKERPASRPSEKVYGTLTGAEGSSSQNLSVDSEGNVKANPDANRFVAPLFLAMAAAVGEHQDADGGGGASVSTTTVASSNGFGLIGPIIAVTVTSANIATGFGAYAFAKSIYFRFLTRGHEVTFPKDTEVEVALTTR
jgi:hypothetical protein